MFKKLVQKLINMAGTRNVFDPSSFNDPIAMQTKWTPAKGGGASFRTHKLVNINSYRMEFRVSAGAVVFYLMFLLMGLSVMIIFSIANFSANDKPPFIAIIMPLSVGLVFTIIGACMLYFGTAPIVFDKQKGFFWKGRKAPDEVFDKTTIKHFTELENIHALQLISEYCRGNKSSYYSYELNLILKDGNRINVVDHGNQRKLKEDANTLSAFLEKPVWDAI